MPGCAPASRVRPCPRVRAGSTAAATTTGATADSAPMLHTAVNARSQQAAAPPPVATPEPRAFVAAVRPSAPGRAPRRCITWTTPLGNRTRSAVDIGAFACRGPLVGNGTRRLASGVRVGNAGCDDSVRHGRPSWVAARTHGPVPGRDQLGLHLLLVQVPTLPNEPPSVLAVSVADGREPAPGRSPPPRATPASSARPPHAGPPVERLHDLLHGTASPQLATSSRPRGRQ